MPNNVPEENVNLNTQKIKGIKSAIENIMDNIYRYTYYSPAGSDNKYINKLNVDIDKSINGIINNNMELIGVPNISKLYTRLADSTKRREDGGSKEVASIFEKDTTMMGLDESFIANTYLKEMDDEIDSVCKYMPKLQEALDTKRDNVLSAEHYSKDFLTMNSDSVDDEENSQFKNRTDTIKGTYNLLEFVTEVYDKASKYGEDFIYVVPYEKALSKLLKNKSRTQIVTINMESSGILFKDGESGNVLLTSKLTYLTESTGDSIVGNKKESEGRYVEKSLLDENERLGLIVEISEDNIIDSVISSKRKALSKLNSINEHSLFNIRETPEEIKADADTDFKKQIQAQTNVTGNLSIDGLKDNKRKEKDLDFTSNDGLVNEKKYKVKVPGCVLKRLDHTRVCPIYIEDMCMGYYYLELSENDTMDTHYGLTSLMADPMVSSNMNRAGALWNNVEKDKQDQVIRYLSSKLSQFIDKKFINNNQDLRQEIYMILKSNDIFNNPSINRLRITFVPPEEMIHVYFRMNPYTHRGISDLDAALMPAKIYCATYLTNTLQNLTRGYDKRVYYVKQTVETNIAKSLLNTITQIKQNDMNIRHFRSINTVLGITGRFNDYIIPENSSGESPIRMETIQGNPAQVDENLLNSLEEMAINATDVPLELIQARQSMQFATEYSMSSIKFLRKVYKRQSQYEIFLSRLVTKLYNCEYDTNIAIKVTLPPPIFLSITNSTQVLENARAYVENIVNTDLGDNPDPTVRTLYFKKLMDEYVGTYIDVERNKTLLTQSMMESKESVPSADTTGGGMDMGGMDMDENMM